MTNRTKVDPESLAFAAAVIAARKAAGLTQQKLAQVTDLSLSTINRVERGDGSSRSTVDVLMRALPKLRAHYSNRAA